MNTTSAIPRPEFSAGAALRNAWVLQTTLAALPLLIVLGTILFVPGSAREGAGGDRTWRGVVLWSGGLGALLGLAQARLLATRWAPPTWSRGWSLAWVVATAGGWSLGVGLVDPLVPIPAFLATAPATQAADAQVLLASAALGALVGAAQWLVLRRHLAVAGLWIPTYACAVAGAALAAKLILGRPDAFFEGFALIFSWGWVLLALGGAGLVFASITGYGLTTCCTLRRATERPAWLLLMLTITPLGGLVLGSWTGMLPLPAETQRRAPAVEALAFSLDSHTLAVGYSGARHPLQLWDFAASAPTARYLATSGGFTGRLLFRPDGHTLLGIANGVQVWDLAQPAAGARLLMLPPSTSYLTQLRSDSLALVAVEGRPSGEYRIGIYSIAPAPVFSVALTLPVSRRVAALAWDGTGRYLVASQDQFDTGDGQVLLLWDLHRPTAPVTVGSGYPGQGAELAMSPDGQLLAAAFGDGGLRVWHLADLTTAPIRLENAGSPLFSPDSRYLLAAGPDGRVQFWSTGQLAQATQILTTTECWKYPAFSPDGRWLAAGCDQGRVQLWDVGAGLVEPPARFIGP